MAENISNKTLAVLVAAVAGFGVYKFQKHNEPGSQAEIRERGWNACAAARHDISKFMIDTAFSNISQPPAAEAIKAQDTAYQALSEKVGQQCGLKMKEHFDAGYRRSQARLQSAETKPAKKAQAPKS